jgi:arylsulfatase A
MRSILIAIALMLALFPVTRAGEAEGDLPNFVIIFADDQGYSDVGCFGAKGFKTPHLDRMAEEGIRFTSFYVTSPVCSASRAGLMTGCYHSRVGIRGALNPETVIGIHENEMTLGELVKQKGYATAAVGKWHLGHHSKFLPPNHGFDSYFGLPYSNDMSPDPKHNPRGRARKWPPLPLIRELEAIEHEPDQSQLTRRYTKEALKFIAENRERPFLLYLAHTMPHVPIYASKDFVGKTERGLFGDVIQEIDWSVGQILEELQRFGLDQRTLVIFTCDNGPWKVMGNHGGSCDPLRGSKGTVWEGGVRVPFIARWPGRVPAGAECDEPAMTIDILPTIAHLIGAKLPDHKIDGESILPLLTAEQDAKSPHEALFFYYQGNQLQAMRSGKWKLHFPHQYRNVKEPGADGKPGTYEHPSTGLELYDLEADISETTDVAGEHPDVVERLSQMAEQMRAELGDALTEREGNARRSAGAL